MSCKHNWQYTQGHFFCTKCNVVQGTEKKSTSKKPLLIIPVVLVGIIVLFASGVSPEITQQGKLFLSDYEDINELENLNEIINEKKIELHQLKESQGDSKVIKTLEDEIKKVQKDLDELIKEKEIDKETIEKFKKDFDNFQHTKEFSEYALDCEKNPLAIGHVEVDPGKINDSFIEKCGVSSP